MCVCTYFVIYINKLCLMIISDQDNFDVNILDHLEAAVTVSNSIAPPETNGSNTNTEQKKSSQHPYHWDAECQGRCSEYLAPQVAKADKYADIPIICTSLVITMSQHTYFIHIPLSLSGSSWLGTSPSPVSPPPFPMRQATNESNKLTSEWLALHLGALPS